MSAGQLVITKVWGTTRELVDSQHYSLHELSVVSGGYCSLHYHRDRANRFRVTSGLIEIVEMIGPSVTRTTLGPDTVHDVPSLVVHMFIVWQSGTMFEEYYPDRGGSVRRDDIVRLREGGMVLPSDLGKLPHCLFCGEGKSCNLISPTIRTK